MVNFSFFKKFGYLIFFVPIWIFCFYGKKKHKKNLLTERFCQDPQENWFGRERSLGSTKDNPSITSMASMIVLTDEPLSC